MLFDPMAITLGQISLLWAVSVCNEITLLSGSVGGGQGSGHIHFCYALGS